MMALATAITMAAIRGTCYFLGVLASQAVLLQHILPPQDVLVACDPPRGIYVARFWFHNKWRTVAVDDLLPVRHSTAEATRGATYLLGAECKDDSPFLAILEKAWGKLHRQMSHVCGGFARQAAVNVCGGTLKSLGGSPSCPEARIMSEVRGHCVANSLFRGTL